MGIASGVKVARNGPAAVCACYEHTVITAHVRHHLCGLNRGKLIEFVRNKFGFRRVINKKTLLT
jgi:hypothetical protein